MYCNSFIHNDKKTARIFYWTGKKNVGDEINPFVISKVLGLKAYLSTDRSLPHILGIGSILSKATTNSFIWGTGMMHPDYGIGGANPRKVLALRGKLSYMEFQKARGNLGDIPLGDPGLLFPELFNIYKSRSPKYELGIIPHYVDYSHPFINKMRKQDCVRVLNVKSPIAEFFKDLSLCKAIASSSLHGLIFAESMSIPNLWIKLSDKVQGAGFKFYDWFSLTRYPQLRPFIPKKTDTQNIIINNCAQSYPIINSNDLKDALSKKAIFEALSSKVCK